MSRIDRLRRLRWRTVRRRIADERRARMHSAVTARTLTPPPPQAFAAFGNGSIIVPPARVTMPEAIEIGDGVVIHEHAWISVVGAVEGHVPKLMIGDGTHIDRLCHIACVGTIEIQDQVLMGERVLIGDTFHEYEDVTTPVIGQPMAPPEKITVERGSYIGLGAMLMPGVTVGEQAYVGAGALVTADVPPRTVAVGNPARMMKRYDDERATWVDVTR